MPTYIGEDIFTQSTDQMLIFFGDTLTDTPEMF